MARSFVAASIGAMRLLTIALAGVLVACSATGVGPAGVDGTKTDQPSAAATEQPATTELPAPTPTPSATAMTSSIPRWDELPVAANDAVGLSQQLVMVETALHDPNVTGLELAWMGHLQQLAYSRLQDFPEWKDTVLAALPEQTRAAVNGSLEAGKQLRMLSGPVPKTLPDWKIVAPAPIDDLISYYKEAESEFGVSWYYLASIHLVETRMGRIRGLSSAGAQGPMQFMPATWAMYGKGDIDNDHDAILGAARYLKAAGAPANMQKALFAYNHSQAYVNALMLYAEAMKADPAAYRGYHGWQVYYPTKDGPVLLPVGWVKE
ncbi:MAG: lytic transglycosylase domain-containing protein [Chloroflexi bacterium]|nr:MAG: lytic transglycosylase domain-containing protein [Chloroflexota bacterium]